MFISKLISGRTLLDFVHFQLLDAVDLFIDVLLQLFSLALVLVSDLVNIPLLLVFVVLLLLFQLAQLFPVFFLSFLGWGGCTLNCFMWFTFLFASEILFCKACFS